MRVILLVLPVTLVQGDLEAALEEESKSNGFIGPKVLHEVWQRHQSLFIV